MTNKKVRLIVIIVVAVLIITGGAVLILMNLNKQNSVTKPEQTKEQMVESANDLKDKALEAKSNNDPEQAKTNLEEAKKLYEEAGDVNNTVDTEALLYLLEHPSEPSSTPDTTEPINAEPPAPTL